MCVCVCGTKRGVILLHLSDSQLMLGFNLYLILTILEFPCADQIPSRPKDLQILLSLITSGIRSCFTAVSLYVNMFNTRVDSNSLSLCCVSSDHVIRYDHCRKSVCFEVKGECKPQSEKKSQKQLENPPGRQK